jgi:hypothetical protein
MRLMKFIIEKTKPALEDSGIIFNFKALFFPHSSL